MAQIEDIRRKLKDYPVTVNEDDHVIIVKTENWVSKDVFSEISKAIKDFGGKWVSAGKESHFEISKQQDNGELHEARKLIIQSMLKADPSLKAWLKQELEKEAI